MTDTIFVPSFGNRPRILVGREDILRQFELCLDSIPGSRERAVLLLGQRGYGKTVLLLELAERGKKHDCFTNDCRKRNAEQNFRKTEGRWLRIFV